MTTIWVKVDTLAANSLSSIILYYGDATTTNIVSNIDSVMLSVGNDSLGTGSSQSGQTIGTTKYRFPVDCRTVRWRVYSGDSADIRQKTIDSLDLPKGTKGRAPSMAIPPGTPRTVPSTS